jgi:hypothetical protein
MSKNVRKASSPFTVVCTVCLATVLTIIWAWSPVTTLWIFSWDDHSSSLETSSAIDTTWRHTKFGWQDSAGWSAADSYRPQQAFELLHPLIWAAIVLISVIGTMILASSEWEVKQLLRRNGRRRL